MKGLRTFEFTIEEYIKNPEAVLSEAMTVTKSQSLTEQDVKQYLDGKCRQKMMDSFLCYQLLWPNIDCGLMLCNIDGRKVEFVIKVTPRYMSISMLLNGEMLVRDLELNPASSAIFTESPYFASAISEYGLEKAKSLAVDLYYRNKH